MVQAPARTVRYGPDDAQLYDVRLPPGPPLGSTVIVVHGGFWRARYDRTHAAPLAQALAQQGYHVAVPEYRRTGMPGGGWPGTFEDVRAALAAIRADVDLPTPCVLVGHSAGGHLATWALSQPEGAGLLGAVSLAGCLDLALTARLGLSDDAAQALMGGGPDDLAGRYALADPAALAPAPAPVHLVHGTDDADVPLAVSVSYQRICAERGTTVALTVIPGGGHLILIDPDDPAFTILLDAVHELAGRD